MANVIQINEISTVLYANLYNLLTVTRRFTRGAGTATHPEHLGSPLVFSVVCVARSFSFGQCGVGPSIYGF